MANTQKKIGSKNVYILLSFIGIIFIAVLIITVISYPGDMVSFLIRLFALWGYICLAVAAIMTPFLKEIYKMFGKPFLKVHHFFAFSGLLLITLHPAYAAFQSRSAAVLIPVFTSWYGFWVYAGRPALIVLYLAIIVVLFRKKLKFWRIIHSLMYLVLFLGFIHAFLIGTDFNNILIKIIYSVLFAFTIASFIIKRLQLYKAFKKNQ
jgi:methionine sulfoxide reductase heme-binding subunit